MGLGLILLGWWIVPNTSRFAFDGDSLLTWSGWTLLGMGLLGSGIFAMLKAALFAVRSRGTDGEWNFKLTEDELIWRVPVHAHGPETGFRCRLDEIADVEFRTIKRYEDSDLKQYWVNFTDRPPVQLRSYANISLRWLVGNISKAGVRYTETQTTG